MAWFCVHDGISSDLKWPLIARNSGQTVPTVISIWLAMLEHANQNEDRGSLEGFGFEELEMFYGLEPGACQSVYDAMEARGLIAECRIVNWERYDANTYLQATAIQDVSTWRLEITQSEWKKLRQIVFERDNYTCAYCGQKVRNPHCDHIFPVSLGGLSTLDNLTTACPACNISKGNKMLSEWQ